jgi:tetratricopeptide (TPR) repeat protein
MGLFDWFRKRQPGCGERDAVTRPADTSSRPSAGTPYERGVAHLKRGEYAEAVAALTEAIGLNPAAPNAYVGRALAYRSLGDEAAAARDEEQARALGGPERSAWDRLVNRAYRRWRGDLSDPAWPRADPLSRDAFLLRQWTWQIYNGGLPQWVANGYGAWAEDLARAAETVGTTAAREVAAVVRDVAHVLGTRPAAREAMARMLLTPSETGGREEEEIFEALSRCEASYDRVGHAFAADVEAWLDRQPGEAP